MKSNYKKLGPYIREVDIRNTAGIEENLLGVSTQKVFIVSIANTVGTDFSKYKVVKRGQFTYVPDTSRRGDKIGLAILEHLDEGIVSSAYTVFEIINHNELLPEYLMMWFRRPEFDRYARFMSHGSVREIFGWEEMCNVELPIPHIDKQKEIVAEYNTIANRIKLNEQLNQKLEETAQAIYKQWFVDFEFPDENGKPYKSSGGEMEYSERLDSDLPVGWSVKDTNEVISVKDGTHDSPKPSAVGYALVTSTHLEPFSVNTDDAYLICEEDYIDVNRRSRVELYDILFSMIGTVGTISLVLKEPVDFAIKNVGLFKTSQLKKYVLYLLFYLKSPVIRDYIQTCLLGSTQNYMTLTELRNIPFVIPDDSVLKEFNKIANPLVDNIRILTLQTYALGQLKATLLGKIAQAEATA
ncbi:MAG: restriction endonuclease subunit S [Candidatus Neomarinimicrobiota bacterium]